MEKTQIANHISLKNREPINRQRKVDHVTNIEMKTICSEGINKGTNFECVWKILLKSELI